MSLQKKKKIKKFCKKNYEFFKFGIKNTIIKTENT